MPNMKMQHKHAGGKVENARLENVAQTSQQKPTGSGKCRNGKMEQEKYGTPHVN